MFCSLYFSIISWITGKINGTKGDNYVTWMFKLHLYMFFVFYFFYKFTCLLSTNNLVPFLPLFSNGTLNAYYPSWNCFKRQTHILHTLHMHSNSELWNRFKGLVSGFRVDFIFYNIFSSYFCCIISFA